MDKLKVQKKTVETANDEFAIKLKNRFHLEGSSLLGKEMEFSNFFEKDNSKSFDFSILKIKFQRATLREASSFKKFMEKQIAQDGRNIVVDLNNCEFVDSSFFGVLVAGVKRMKAMDKKFVLVYDSKNRLPIFSATGLDKVFSVYSTIEEAIKLES